MARRLFPWVRGGLRLVRSYYARNRRVGGLFTANWNLEDHEARAGLYPELIGAYGAEPAGQSVVPWTNVDPEEQMYEYACHDDNYDMVNLLIGARSREANGKTTDLD